MILITRLNHDLTTNYLFYWSELVIEEAKRKKLKVLDLKAKKANKSNFTSYIKKHRPGLIFFNGHGNKNSITGQDEEVLVETNNNEAILSGAIVYARSCDAAENLGRRSIKKGTKAFVGYRRRYYLGYSAQKTTRPLRDEIARLFLEPSNLIPISLLKGNSAEKAYQKSQEAMQRNFLFMLSTRASDAQRDAAPYLWINKRYQSVFGNHSASL